MPTTLTEKSFIRVEVPRAVRQLRKRLGVSQDRLAELVGPQVSMITVSRWERGALMPYPKNRQRLWEIAMEHGWWDIAAEFNVDGDLSFDDWLSVFETNLPQEYRHWMVLGMCALNSVMFEPEDADNPTKKEIEIAE